MFLGLLVALVSMLAVSNVAAQEVKIFVPEFVCDDVAQIHASMLPDGSVGMWSSPMKSLVFENSTAFATVVTGLQKGSNVVVWMVRDSNGKTSETYAVIEHNGLGPIEAFSMDGDVVCDGECRLYGSLPNNAARGYWHTETPDVVLSHTAETMITATNLAPGLNRFFWTVSDANGTCYEEAEIVVENAMVHAKIAESTATVTCGGEGNLEAEPIEANETGYWSVFSPNVRIQDPNNLKTTFSGLDKGSTTFRWTVQNGLCQSSADVSVENGAVEAIVLNDDRETVCGDECELRAYFPEQTSMVGWWTLVSPDTHIVFENQSSSRTMVSNLEKGPNSFRWTVSNGMCQHSKTIVINNNSVTANVLTHDGEIINGTECQLQSELSDNAKGYWTTCSSQIVIEKAESNICTVKNLAEGDNCFVWNVISNDGQCLATSELKIVSKGEGKDTPTPVAETTAKVNTHIWSYDKTIVVENGSNEIQISDTNGRILKTIKADSDRAEIPMQKSGIYVVKTAAMSQKVTIR